MKDKRYGHPPPALDTFILGSLLRVSNKVQINFCNAVKVKRLIQYQQTTIFSKNSIGLVEENPQQNKRRNSQIILGQNILQQHGLATMYFHNLYILSFCRSQKFFISAPCLTSRCLLDVDICFLHNIIVVIIQLKTNVI